MIEHACRSGQDCGRPRCCTVFTRTSTVGRAILVPSGVGFRSLHLGTIFPRCPGSVVLPLDFFVVSDLVRLKIDSFID